MSPETDSTLWPAILKGLTKLVILSRRKTSFSAIFHSGSLFHGYGLDYNTRTVTKRFNEEIITPRGRYTIFHSDSLFTLYHMVMGCIIIQKVKGLMKKFYCLGGRPVSMQNFRFIVHIVYLFLHGCGLHYEVLSTLSVKQEVKGLTKLCTTREFTCKYSLVLWLVSFTSS